MHVNIYIYIYIYIYIVFVCIYKDIINIHSTHIYYVKKNILDAINHLIALVFIFYFISVKVYFISSKTFFSFNLVNCSI